MPLIELNYTPIEEVSIPFNKPYFLKGYCKDMVAVDKWSDIDYLKKNFKNVLINNVEYYKSKKDLMEIAENNSLSKSGTKSDLINRIVESGIEIDE